MMIHDHDPFEEQEDQHEREMHRNS